MTKKDYIKIAAALYYTRPRNRKSLSYEQWLRDVASIAVMLRKENEKFDYRIFYAACGIELE